MSAPRWVRKDAYIYDGCRACGTCYGLTGCERLCSVSTCAACGSVVCSGYGLGSGHCPVCLVGFLSGWSGNDHECGYAGCRERAVADAPRIGHVCAAHLARVKVRVGISKEARTVTLAERVAEALRTRAARFVEVAP